MVGVAEDLRFQLHGGAEFPLGAQVVIEPQLQLLSVEIAVGGFPQYFLYIINLSLSCFFLTSSPQ